MPTTVHLSRGYTATIDEIMIDSVCCYSWHCAKDGYATGRVWQNEPIKKSVLMHRYIYALVHGPIPPKMVIDHINGNKLDNRIENLRCITQAENAQNMKAHRRGHELYKVKGSNKYRAVVWFKKRCYHVGCYATIEEVKAAKQRKLAELQVLSGDLTHHKETPLLN